jgi:hypothetical protein
MSSIITGGLAPTPTLTDLDERARDIFRRVVEAYLETGEPIGSRTLSRGGIQLSPASIRNTLQDLAQLGLLDSPHSSAGRLPTHAGLRLFVDGLLEVGDVGEAEKREIDARLSVPSTRPAASCRAWPAGRALSSARCARPGSSMWSSWRSVPTRRWRSWSSTTARSRTG